MFRHHHRLRSAKQSSSAVPFSRSITCTGDAVSKAGLGRRSKTTMSSPSESKVKKMAGRKRLPPLEPGPALQFVVARHPDDFKDDKTMRHVRSHVMYKHRGVSPRARSTSAAREITASAPTRSFSSMATEAQGAIDESNFLGPTRRPSAIWDGGQFYQYTSHSPSYNPVRDLAAKIISAVTRAEGGTEHPLQVADAALQSGSGFIERSLPEFKAEYVHSNPYGADGEWMDHVCSNPTSFLSHVSVACVAQDVTEGLWYDTELTVWAKTLVIGMIQTRLHDYTDESNVTSILHLLMSEVGTQPTDVFRVHYDGLVNTMHLRGGISSLGLHSRIATFLTVVVLSFAILQGQSEPAMVQGFIPSPRKAMLQQQHGHLSPLYAPQGDLYPLHGICSHGTYQIVNDMRLLTQTFVARWAHVGNVLGTSSIPTPPTQETDLQEIYNRLLLRESTEHATVADWPYECCRLAALIYCRSIILGAPFSETAASLHPRTFGAEETNVTQLSALVYALGQASRLDSFRDLPGVHLWVRLVAGAASFTPCQPYYAETPAAQALAAWIRRSSLAETLNVAVFNGFVNSGATVEAQRRMLRVQHLINVKNQLLPH